IPSLQILYSESGVQAEARSSGLFIPAAHARRALKKMMERPRAAWPWIGLLLEDPLLALSDGRVWRDGEGPRVRRVFPDSPAGAAGRLRPAHRPAPGESPRERGRAGAPGVRIDVAHDSGRNAGRGGRRLRGAADARRAPPGRRRARWRNAPHPDRLARRSLGSP